MRIRSLFDLRMAVLLGLTLLATVVSAQGGEAELQLRVIDESGQGIAQAAVLMRPETEEPVALPPPFFSDEDGQVAIAGLVEGEWQIEVRAGGYMIFTGYLKLIPGLPPVVGFTTKQRTGTFWAPLDVVFGGSSDLSADDLAQAAKGMGKADRKELRKTEKKLREEEKRERELEDQRLAAAEDAERRRYRSTGGAEVAVLAPSPADGPGSDEQNPSSIESGAKAESSGETAVQVPDANAAVAQAAAADVASDAAASVVPEVKTETTELSAAEDPESGLAPSDAPQVEELLADTPAIARDAEAPIVTSAADVVAPPDTRELPIEAPAVVATISEVATPEPAAAAAETVAPQVVAATEAPADGAFETAAAAPEAPDLEAPALEVAVSEVAGSQVTASEAAVENARSIAVSADLPPEAEPNDVALPETAPQEEPVPSSAPTPSGIRIPPSSPVVVADQGSVVADQGSVVADRGAVVADAAPVDTATEVREPDDASRAASVITPGSPEANARSSVADVDPPSPRATPRIPTLASRPVFFTGGACPECKKGEWALIVERRVEPGGSASTCGADRTAEVQKVIEDSFGSSSSSFNDWGGTFGDSYGNGLAAVLPGALDDPALAEINRSGNCQDFVGVLPSGARFVGFRFEALDGNDRGDCFGDQQCGIGEARWSGNPVIERTSQHTIVHASFANESTSRERRARMILLFVPRRDWQAP